MLEERTAPVPRSVEAAELRLEEAELRALLPVLRLVTALLPVERLVRVFWSTVPAERVVEEPVERLVAAEEEPREVELEPVLLVALPVPRWVAEPVERVVVPVERVRSFCTTAERLGAALAERV